MPDIVPIRRALISVSDKDGLADLAKALTRYGVDVISTGGSAKALGALGLKIRDVADVTGFPEMMDGRVKTLHPRIYGGLLARRDLQNHREALSAHDIPAIDLLIVNLYPFESAVSREAPFEECIENIDIGGPALIRAAAKNHADVCVIVDPSDYATLLAELDETAGGTRLSFRKHCASRAYARTANYDCTIAGWFSGQLNELAAPWRSISGKLRESLRYGENPHQQASFYVNGEARYGVATARQVQGKGLSYNNINDTDAAFECVAELGDAQPACAIIKHANPCGVALAGSLAEAYQRALACDPVSAFGGIIALNQKLDKKTAEEIVKIFTEVIIAPDADEDAQAIIATKKNLRLLLAGGLPDPTAPGLSFRSVAGGFLLQTRDNGWIRESDLKVVTKRAPSSRERTDLLLAFRVAKHVKSNAIVYVKDGATVGIGAGQMSRVDSARLAARKAADAAQAAGLKTPPTQGSVVASDAFFPFTDGLMAAVEAGATAVIQPGGSLRDDEIIAAADQVGITMLFTSLRHFRH
jgi:phosphoribosylaminoimidazolecarboxamide formyltransferase/IMP cyclohydrolase